MKISIFFSWRTDVRPSLLARPVHPVPPRPSSGDRESEHLLFLPALPRWLCRFHRFTHSHVNFPGYRYIVLIPDRAIKLRPAMQTYTCLFSLTSHRPHRPASTILTEYSLCSNHGTHTRVSQSLVSPPIVAYLAPPSSGGVQYPISNTCQSTASHRPLLSP